MGLRRLTGWLRGVAAGLDRPDPRPGADLRIRVRTLEDRLGALAPAPGQPVERGLLRNDLGNACRALHLLTGDPDPLDLALRHHREAVHLLRDTEWGHVAVGNLAVTLLDRYLRLGDLTDLDAAITDLGAAVDAAPSPGQAHHLLNLAHARHERFERTRQPGDIAAAVAAGERAVALASPASQEAPGASFNLAIALLSRAGPGDVDRALPLLRAAAALFPDGSPEQARARIDLGIAQLQHLVPPREGGDGHDEIDELLEAVAGVAAGSPARHAGLHAAGTARWRRYQGTGEPVDLESAIGTLQAAVDAAPPDSGDLPLLLNDLGIALSERSFVSDSAQGLADALAAWVRGLTALEHRFDSVALGYKLGRQTTSVQLGLAERVVATYLLLADRAVTGRERMLRNAMSAAELTKSRLVTDLVGGGDLPAPAGVPAALVVTEQRQWADLRAADTAALAGHGRSSVVGGEADARRRQLHAALEATWAAMASSGEAGSAYVGLRRRHRVEWDDLAGLSSRLGATTAVASMFLTNTRTILFVLRDGADAPSVSQIELDRDGWLDVVARFDTEVRRGLPATTETWDERLRPLLREATPHVAGAERVVLAPMGWGLELPWATVARRAGWRAPDGGDLPVVTVASLGFLDRLLSRSRPAGGGCVVVGDPTDDLPHAGAEAQEVAALLGVEPLLGRDATKARVTAALRSARVAHVAGHAHFEAGAPLDSGIVLADGVLTAREILSERIDLDVLVLSACDTAVAETLGGHELAGLSEAFHVAGARCLVASRWKVDDPVTATLMSALYRSWRGGADVAGALRDAMAGGTGVGSPSAEGGRRDARLGGSRPGASPTYYWDSFAVSGDWAQPWPGAASSEGGETGAVGTGP